MRAQFGLLCFGLAISGCGAPTPNIEVPVDTRVSGIQPHIVAGEIPLEDKPAVEAWIAESIAVLQSPEFDANYAAASTLYPNVYVSKTQDIISSARLLDRMKLNDPVRDDYWWPKTYVTLKGERAARTADRLGFGFEGNRKAAAGPYPANTAPALTGEIELGRLHLARYRRGDAVEKSCAINTMVHEISHTLSDKPGQFWMHILDSEDNVTPPAGVFEASYFIGVAAQCTYLQSVGRVSAAGFHACLLTFSNPSEPHGTSARFRSRACDDFPGDKPVTPSGRLAP